MADPGNQSPWKSPATPNSPPQRPTFDVSPQELRDRFNSTRSAISTLLKDTKWPLETNGAVQSFLQTMSSVPELPAEVIPVKDAVEQIIQVLEAVNTGMNGVSDKYGIKERGFRDGFRHKISSMRPHNCITILQTHQDNIHKASALLRTHLNLANMSGYNPASTGQQKTRAIVDSAPSGTLGVSTVLPSSHNHPAMSTVTAEVSRSALAPTTKLDKQTTSSGNPASHQASVPDPSPDFPESQQSRSAIREGVLVAARKTFKTVETVSGAIPGVGDFVGVAAKVGLAFVSTIETMDKNEDVAKELAFHTSKLSTYLEHFKKKSVAEKGDELVTLVDDLHKELECVQEKVSLWNSTGRLKKAFLSSDHAEELRGHQDTVQNALEELQLLVSLKTADLVTELKNTELRAERRRLLDRLGDGSYGARGNSIEDVICLPGTRADILDRIDEWIKDMSTSTERVLWIRGMAGRGKSTIASTVAHRWSSKGSCAIFHFRRGQNALDGQFICALARQLGKGLVPEVKNAILECVGENEDIAKERLDQQFKTLLVGSLEKLQGHPHPIAIIVDALDECINVTDALRFVRLIDEHSSSLPANVKFLLTCRPEAPLLVALEPRKWHVEDLDSIPHVSDDITRFIVHACAQIRDDHSLPRDWPSSADVGGIVKMSQGLFQWARTAITYIGERSPASRLRDLLQRPSAWSGLDDLYHQILSRAFNGVGRDPLRRQLLTWMLGTLVVAPYPVSLEVIAYLHADHKIFQGHQNVVQYLHDDILADLNSLLHIPASQSEPVRLMHTSIRDLLVARERCENQHYFVDPIQSHRRLAAVALQIMVRELRPNICQLSKVSEANSEIQGAAEKHVSKGLRYCCRFWSTHLTTGSPWSETEMKAEVTTDILANFQVFSEEKLLAWLEVMSVVGAVVEASTVAKQAQQWLLQWPQDILNDTLSILWNDAQRFIAAFLEPILFSPLHIYASALPHCPVGTMLWTKYGVQATTRILLGRRQLNWPAKIWSADSTARVVAFSPDGTFLVSSMGRGEIQLWDTQTGAPLGNPLAGHSDSTSVAFSQDGKVLATVLPDETVQLWDAQTGAPLDNQLTGQDNSLTSVGLSPGTMVSILRSNQNTVRLVDEEVRILLGEPLAGHSNSITSVAFSPDGKVRATGSYDKTVQLWDSRTGAPLGNPLTGHSSLINSIVFSPDGKVLATVSDYDETVRLWDTRTGASLGTPLKGHNESVISLVFSPDSRYLATSDSWMVRLWDVSLLYSPGTSHSTRIKSVGLSLDRKVLSTGLYDEMVQLGDPQTGAPLGNPVTGHSKLITSVIFSPDGKVLATISDDKTVRLWDVQTGAPLGNPLTGHSRSITSVVFSPDSRILATGSYDKTVRLWDSRTGVLMGNPLTIHGMITSVAFSSDSKVLATGSSGQTIQLWDVQTGASLGNPLTNNSDRIGSVMLPPNGKALASGLPDGSLQFCDAVNHAKISQPIKIQSNWVVCGYGRLLWLPDRYRNGSHFVLVPSVGRLAFVSGNILSVFDVSQLLER